MTNPTSVPADTETNTGGGAGGTSRGTSLILLRTSAVLWFIWGIAHIWFGYLILRAVGDGDAARVVFAVAASGSIEDFQLAYPEALLAMLNQHGWNIMWFGLFTMAGSFMIWRKHAAAFIATVLVGVLADIGYFTFIDLAGFGGVPADQMIWIAGAAVITGFLAYVRSDRFRAL